MKIVIAFESHEEMDRYVCEYATTLGWTAPQYKGVPESPKEDKVTEDETKCRMPWVTVTDWGNNRVSAIKVIRTHLNMSLKDAKELTDHTNIPFDTKLTYLLRYLAFRVSLKAVGVTLLPELPDLTWLKLD
jgi:ribosomal protein L7/L12